MSSTNSMIELQKIGAMPASFSYNEKVIIPQFYLPEIIKNRGVTFMKSYNEFAVFNGAWYFRVNRNNNAILKYQDNRYFPCDVDFNLLQFSQYKA